MTVDSLWIETPTSTPTDCRHIYWDIVAAIYPDRPPIDILEIGVYKGALVRLLDDSVNVRTYTGVDPYVGSVMDSYFHVYWNGTDEAGAIYRSTKDLFDAKGFTLVRNTSAAYWHECTQSFDVIIIDGDHSYDFALWDMHHWFKRLRPNGLLLIDDYDNPQTPDVTKATTRFLHMNQSAIAHLGYRHYEFINNDLVVPIGMSVVYAQRVPVETNAAPLEDFPARLAFPRLMFKLAKNVYKGGRDLLKVRGR
jgi:hypothetical protein